MAKIQLKDLPTAEQGINGQEYVYISQEDKTRKTTINDISEFTNNKITPHLNQLSNPNLLINSDFRNPINQRNITNITADTVSADGRYHYFIDRWFYQYLGLKATIVVDDNGILLTSAGNNGDVNPRVVIGQAMEIPYGVFADNDITLSFDIETNTKVDITLGGHDTTYTWIMGKTVQGSSSKILKERVYVTGKAPSTMPDRVLRASIALHDGGYLRIKNAKLEIGVKVTPFIPRPFAEELALCQRYYELALAYGRDNGTTNSIHISIPFKVTKRVNPTKTTLDNDPSYIYFNGNWNNVNGSLGLQDWPNPLICQVSYQNPTYTFGDYQLRIACDAEIY